MELRTRHTFLFFLAIFVFGWIPTEANGYCPGADSTHPKFDPQFYSVNKEYNRAKYVVRVRTLRETWLGEDGKPKPLEPPFQYGGTRPWGFDPYMGAYYDVEVIETFKGSPQKQLRLFSENSTARFFFDIGSEVLLFVTEGRFDSPIGLKLTIDTCGNSAHVSKAQATIKTLKQLSPRK